MPEPKADYPIDYVLDGQQRVTAIFGVFQTDLPMVNPISWENIYFDLQADTNAQDPQFVALSNEEVDPKRHFSLNAIFATSSYRKATKDFDDETAKRIDDMQAVFKETQIPRQLSSTDDKATVAIIFERVNRQGVPLDTLQLLSAWRGAKISNCTSNSLNSANSSDRLDLPKLEKTQTYCFAAALLCL